MKLIKIKGNKTPKKTITTSAKGVIVSASDYEELIKGGSKAILLQTKVCEYPYLKR